MLSVVNGNSVSQLLYQHPCAVCPFLPRSRNALRLRAFDCGLALFESLLKTVASSVRRVAAPRALLAYANSGGSPASRRLLRVHH